MVYKRTPKVQPWVQHALFPRDCTPLVDTLLMAAEDGEDFRVRRLQEHVASFDAPGPVDAAGVADSAAAEAWLSDVARETLRRSARPINVF